MNSVYQLGVVQADCGTRIVWLYSVRAQHTHTSKTGICLVSYDMHRYCCRWNAPHFMLAMFLQFFNKITQLHILHGFLEHLILEKLTGIHPSKITRFKIYWAYIGYVANFIKFSANTKKEKLIYGMSLDIYTMTPTPYRLYNTSYLVLLKLFKGGRS